MADQSYLFGGAPPASITSTLTDSSSTLPAWLQEYTRSLAGQAVAVAGAPYQTYQAPTDVQNYGAGTRIAGQDPMQQQAYNQMQQNVGNYQPYLNTASQTLPQAVGQYMNPYTSNVTDEIARLGQRNLTENLLPQVNSTFTGAGQFGSTRNADFTNRALRDANESILGQQSQALQSGFQNAMTNANADLTRQANLGQLTQQLGIAQAGAMDTMGAQQQATKQKNLDLAYQDFLQQRDFQKSNLGYLSDIIRGMPASSYGFTTSSTPSSTPTANMSPLLAAAQGFLGTRAMTSPTQTATQPPR